MTLVLQLLFGRRTRTTLPTTPALLIPHVQDPANIMTKHKENQLNQKYYYDKNTKPLPPLEEGSVVRMKGDTRKGEWKKAVVIAPRSYLIQNKNGRIYRRNRHHLVRTGDKPDPIDLSCNKDFKEWEDCSSGSEINSCSHPKL